MHSRADRSSASADRARAAILAASIAAITAVHLIVTVGTHREHVIHVLFRGLYLLPVVAGALWFRLRGALVCAIAAAVAYAGHMLLSWHHQPMENANQAAMIAVFLFVGTVSGTLAEREERERRRRLASERWAQRAAVVQGIAGLSNALGFRDEYTREHSERVARLAVDVGRGFGLDAERLEILRLAGLMHDVGKIGVRDDILFKPAELDPEERKKVERHPLLAAEILRPIRGTEEIAEIVLSHHECPDGSGYPGGLRGDEIPLEARILRVADVYSALTDARSYKPGMEQGPALQRMKEVAGTKLDSRSLDALRGMVERDAPGMSGPGS